VTAPKDAGELSFEKGNEKIEDFKKGARPII
jgi:hypothetical protein